MIEFQKFNKIPRLNRDMIISEKLDGTNAQIFIEHEAVIDKMVVGPEVADWFYENSVRVEDMFIFAGSRKRWIVPGKDNFGFAKWVWENAMELVALGPGNHYGEWWGQGIQRKYGLKEKRFSLFNVSRWENPLERPNCCHCVPVLYEGPFDTAVITDAVDRLQQYGSKAAPGFMDPEGLVVFHTAAGQYFKVTCQNDAVPKALIGISL